MEKELNIAAILKEKPKGTKLWSPIFGNCKFSRLSSESGIRVFPIHNGFTSTEEKSFFKTGQYTLAGEVCLFPSKQMRDWSKFAWKKGDVLVSNDSDCHIIFEGFSKDDYTKFEGKHWVGVSIKRYISCLDAQDTQDYHIEDDKAAAQTYINTVEERLGGKLNLETLEIEHPKQEFKDGDIVSIEDDNDYKAIIIYKSNGGCMFRSYALIDNIYNQLGIDKIVNTLGRWIHLATDSEQQQLFSALEKEGKRWNPDTKQIEDLPKKCEFKAMDWCLMRDVDEVEYRGFVTSEWVLCQFSHYLEGYKFVAVGGNWFGECIPYNEETKHLLGTTDDWKGGEQ